MCFRSLVPQRWSDNCRKVFLCGVVHFPTSLTGWLKSFWLSFGSISFFIVIVVVIVSAIIVVVRDLVICSTVSISRTILRLFSLLFLFLQLATLIFIKSRFFTVVAHRFGSVSTRVCFMLAHSVSLWLIRSFQTVQLQFLFKVCDNLFKCANFQMDLISSFFQV